MLQCVAACVAVFCNVLQCVSHLHVAAPPLQPPLPAVCCSVLQCDTVCCSVLQFILQTIRVGERDGEKERRREIVSEGAERECTGVCRRERESV